MSNLTKKQERVYRAILRLMHKLQTPPSVREIMKEVDISTPNGVQQHLRALEEKGLITHKAGQSRSIRLVKPGRCPYCRK